MPTQTFFNLSEEKRRRLIDAAMKEFAHMPVNQASIANIIKYADISRGSFYQYFEDKQDLYLYLIGIFKYNTIQLMKKTYREVQGEFIEGFEQFAKKYVRYIMESEKVEFFKNMYLYMDYQVSREFGGEAFLSQKSPNEKENGKRVVDVINWDSLSVETREEKVELMRFTMSILNQVIMEGFSKEWSIEQTQKHFLKRLEWISEGVKKDKKETTKEGR